MLYVISSLSYDASLLSHFLKYYENLGIRSFIISIQELVPGIQAEAQLIAAQFDCQVMWVPVSERQALSGIEANNKEEIRAKYVKPTDWVIPADLDEFIQFPAPVEILIQELSENDATFIKGDFRDRISAIGALIPASKDVSIWQQFPLECNISQKLVRCWCHKVTLCRGDCLLSSGHHNVILPAHPLITIDSCII